MKKKENSRPIYQKNKKTKQVTYVFLDLVAFGKQLPPTLLNLLLRRCRWMTCGF